MHCTASNVRLQRRAKDEDGGLGYSILSRRTNASTLSALINDNKCTQDH